MPIESDINSYQNDSETDTKSIADNNGMNGQNSGSKLLTGTFDPTAYVQKARVTRPPPPKPSYNPMQFVQIKPCSLYQQAQTQLKKVEEVKKVQEIKKEEPEDWQNNLDNWKSSRRKRVEHIIDRVVEVKKLELEEHDRNRRKSKTFSEMLEERGDRKGRVNKLASLAVYTEDDTNDLSDFGIGTSSASGKSSLSEDYDSVTDDNIDIEKHDIDTLHLPNTDNNGVSNRDYVSSPGYDTSSSTAPASSPDPCEYTYEGAIQDYKQRISRAQSNNYNNNGLTRSYSKDSTPERTVNDYMPRRLSSSKIEDRLMNFELKSANEINDCTTSIVIKDLPKVDILKRRELFEKDQSSNIKDKNRLSGEFISNSKLIRERVSSIEKKKDDTKKQNQISSGDISSIQNRLQSLENKQYDTENITNNNQKTNTVLPISISIKDRLSSLQNAVATKEEIKKGPVQLIDEHQLEVLKQEEQKALQIKENTMKNLIEESNHNDTDHEDSGIHTTDVSCSVSQTEEQVENVNEENHHINIDSLLIEKSKSDNNNSLPLSLSSETEDDKSVTPEPDFELSVSESSPSIASQLTNINLSVMGTNVVNINDNNNLESKNDNIGDGNIVNSRNNLKLSNLECITPNSLTPSLSPCSPRGFINDIFEDQLTGRNVICVLNPKFPSVSTSPITSTKTSSNLNSDWNRSQLNLSSNQKISNADIKEPKAQINEIKLRTESEKKEFVLEEPITENICDKIDIQKEVNNVRVTATPYFEVSLTDIARCDKKHVPINNNNRNDNNNLISQANRNISKSPDRSRLLDLVQKETIYEKDKQKLQTDNELSIKTGSNNNSIPQKISPKPILSPKPKIIPQKPQSIKSKISQEISKPKLQPKPDLDSPKKKLIFQKVSPTNLPDTAEVISYSNESSRFSIESQSSDTSVQTVIDVDTNFHESNASLKNYVDPISIVQPVGSSSLSNDNQSSSDIKPKNSGGVLVAKLEIVETTIKVRSNENSPVTPRKPFITDELDSPKFNQNTHPNSKPVNIFDFIKKNFNNNESKNENEESDLNLDKNILSLSHSKFYVPSPTNTEHIKKDVIQNPTNSSLNEVNIEITKVFKTENIVEKIGDTSNESNLTSEINELLDKEIAKLTAEDSRI